MKSRKRPRQRSSARGVAIAAFCLLIATAGAAAPSARAAGGATPGAVSAPASPPAQPAAPAAPAPLTASPLQVLPAGSPAAPPGAVASPFRERPDPFKPFVDLERETAAKKGAAAGGAAKTKVKTVPLSPLQRISLDQFKLLGSAGDERRRTAVVEAMEGGKKKYFSLRVGTLIGQNGGKVVEVGLDRIVVEEREEIAPGKTKANRITLRIRESEGKP